MPYMELVMLWSEGCEACRRTKPIIHKISTMFPDILFSYYKIVNQNYKIFLMNQLNIDVLEDTTLSFEEKQDLIKKGIFTVSSLPTFILRDYRRPKIIYEIIMGGVGKPPNIQERSRFEKLFIAMLKKYDDISNRRSIIKYQYGEFEVRNDLWG